MAKLVIDLSMSLDGFTAGQSHTLALNMDGTLWAWGLNTTGQLGIGSTAGQTGPVQVPTP